MYYRWLKSKELPLIQILVGGDAALSRPKRVTDISVMTVPHTHYDVLVSDPHPAHLVLRAAFDRLFWLLSGIPSGRLPVPPYEVDKAIADGVRLRRWRCVVDDRLQRYGVHLYAVPVTLGEGWSCALLLLRCSGGPLLEMLADNGCAGAVQNGPVLEDGNAEAVYHVQSITAL